MDDDKKYKFVGCGAAVWVIFALIQDAKYDYFEFWLIIGVAAGMFIGGVIYLLSEIDEDE